MGKTSRACYWLSVIGQCAIWVFGETESLRLLGKADAFTAGALITLAAAAIFFATVGMIFPRKGKRVFIAKTLFAQAIKAVLLGAFLCAFGWVFMGGY